MNSIGITGFVDHVDRDLPALPQPQRRPWDGPVVRSGLDHLAGRDLQRDGSYPDRMIGCRRSGLHTACDGRQPRRANSQQHSLSFGLQY